MISELPEVEGLLPIATATVCRDTILEFDLYILRPGREKAELYRSASYPIGSGDIEKLQTGGVDHLYIATEKADAYRRYLFTHVLGDKLAAPTLRVEAVREATRVALENALVGDDHDTLVATMSELGNHLAQLVTNQSLPFAELFAALKHDYYTFTHVCNVSVYCVSIARQSGITDHGELAQIATGALLHDVGKRHIPASVLNKCGRPTDDEWELIRQHPTRGFRELADRDDVSWGQLMMVYQHHEKLDGSGYPTGIHGDEMHPWARICAVADVFDALTCQRPYRKPMPKADVCEHLSRHADKWFDAEIVTNWTQHVRKTP